MEAARNNPGASGIAGGRVTLWIVVLLGLLTASAQPINADLQKSEAGQQKRALVRQIYTSQIGIREKGTNSGPAVEEYLRYVNLPKGNPWCAAFVCWVFGQAGVGNPRSGWSPDLFRDARVIWDRSREPGIKSLEPGLPKSASGEPGIWNQEPGHLQSVIVEPGIKSQESGHPQNVPRSYASSLATGSRQLATEGPQPSDIFGLYFPEKSRIAHVGFIDQWDGTWLISVEGNTNVSGSREGDGVYRKRRLVRSIYKVARYVND